MLQQRKETTTPGSSAEVRIMPVHASSSGLISRQVSVDKTGEPIDMEVNGDKIGEPIDMQVNGDGDKQIQVSEVGGCRRMQRSSDKYRLMQVNTGG